MVVNFNEQWFLLLGLLVPVPVRRQVRKRPLQCRALRFVMSQPPESSLKRTVILLDALEKSFDFKAQRFRRLTPKADIYRTRFESGRGRGFYHYKEKHRWLALKILSPLILSRCCLICNTGKIYNEARAHDLLGGEAADILWTGKSLLFTLCAYILMSNSYRHISLP